MKGWESSKERSNGMNLFNPLNVSPVLAAVSCSMSGAEDCGAGWGCMPYPRRPMDEGRGNLEYDIVEGSDTILDELRASLPFLCAYPFIGFGWCDIFTGETHGALTHTPEIETSQPCVDEDGNSEDSTGVSLPGVCDVIQ